MAKLEFDKLEDAIEYIKENEKAIDDYSTLSTTFENYKTQTDSEVDNLRKKQEELQQANMTLYLQTCQDTKKDDIKDDDKKPSLNDIINKI